VNLVLQRVYFYFRTVIHLSLPCGLCVCAFCVWYVCVCVGVCVLVVCGVCVCVCVCVRGVCGCVCVKEVNYVYSSPNFVRVIKSKLIKCSLFGGSAKAYTGFWW